jgi:hypothetical protein
MLLKMLIRHKKYFGKISGGVSKNAKCYADFKPGEKEKKLFTPTNFMIFGV